MSKIYEALLRAEREREASAGPAPSRAITVQDIDAAPPFVPVSAPTQKAARSGTASAVLPPLDIFEPYSSKREDGSNRSESALFDTQWAGRPYPWSPRPGAMPALESSGPRVEQFRTLRSHLQEFRDTHPLNTVLVSSGLPGEGKSFVALNLALSFARHRGNRVLLIDGDMRRGSLHTTLGTPNTPGLSEYLSAEAELSDVLQVCGPEPTSGTPSNSPQSIGLHALTFIPSGTSTERAGDLAASPKFADLLAAAASQFDWIFIDSSPVNLVSDAVSLARACQGVLLVARDGTTRFKTAQQAQAQFKNANVLGFVLNAVQKLPPKSDYYGSYGSYIKDA